MNCFKKTALLVAISLSFSVLAEGLLSFPFLYPIKNPTQFNETSRYISGLRYSWVVSFYLPEHVQEFAGKWHLQAGAGWLHAIPRKPPSASKDKKAIKPLISYYPAIFSAGISWELYQLLHYVRPVLGMGYALNNPLGSRALLQTSFLDKKSYFITAGLLFSFDILDSNFSHRMSHEYNILDMGLFAEYHKYYSLERENENHWGINIGLFVAF